MKKLVILSFILLIIDRITKVIISSLGSFTIIKGFFNLTYVRNYGAAWSILTGYRFLLILVSILILVGVIMYIRKKDLNNYLIITYSMLISGIIGNLIDRILYGYVIDFLDFNIFGYNYPIFNIADSLIVISIIMLIINEFLGDKCGSNK